MEPYLSYTPEELREVREAFGYTQRQWALALGFVTSNGRASVSKLETGHRPLSPIVARLYHIYISEYFHPGDFIEGLVKIADRKECTNYGRAYISNPDRGSDAPGSD